MEKIKDWLKEKLGTIGVVISFLLPLLILALPFVMIGLPFWATALIIFLYLILQGLPIIGLIFDIALWVWGLIAAINGKQDFFAYLYYVVFGIFAIDFIVRTVAIFNETKK
ncbi:MAG: hypothetical protein IKB98_00280 [Clostridia bacterium]|nr:hypothetical protein [Clostridia bacterium]